MRKLMKLNYLLVLIIFLAIFFRFFRFEQRFNFDTELNTKAWAVLNAWKQLTVQHKIPLIGIEAVSYINHLFYPPFFLFFLIPFFRVSDFQPALAEIAILSLSALTIFFIYKSSLSLFDKKTAYFASLIYALSFFTALTDKFIWVVGMIIPFSSLSLFLIIKRRYLLLGTALAIGISLHFQMFIPLLSSVALLAFTGKLSKKERIKKILILILPTLLIFLPIFIFDLRHDFFNLRGVAMLFNSGKKTNLPLNFISSQEFYFQPIVSIISSELSNFIVNLKSGVIFFVINISFILLVFRITKNTASRIASDFIRLNFLLSFLMLPFVKNQFYSPVYYLYYLIPFSVILGAYCFTKILKKNVFISFVLFSAFIFINIKTQITFEVHPNYSEKKNAIHKILSLYEKKYYRKHDLYIYFENVEKNKYDYLLNLEIEEFKKNKKTDFKYYSFESWQNFPKPAFVISQKGEKIVIKEIK